MNKIVVFAMMFLLFTGCTTYSIGDFEYLQRSAHGKITLKGKIPPKLIVKKAERCKTAFSKEEATMSEIDELLESLCPNGQDIYGLRISEKYIWSLIFVSRVCIVATGKCERGRDLK